MFYAKKESFVLIGNTLVKKEGYFATLCFMTEDNEFIDISLTKGQLIAMQEVVSQGISIVEKEGEKNRQLESEFDTLRSNKTVIFLDFPQNS